MSENSGGPLYEPTKQASAGSVPTASPVAWLLVLFLAAGLRAWDLGSLSFWYDEVVSMRLAAAPGPSALIDRLGRIDATRAPLHPLLLQAWTRVFGTSETASRSLSAVFGIATVGLVYWIGRMVFDPPAGLWGAWLAAVSPPLVYYAREARMYALLVWLTCLCWGCLFSMRGSAGSGFWYRACAYVVSLAALLYTHPLGLLMAGTLAFASLLDRRAFFGSNLRWLGAHAMALLAVAPWIPRYFDHPPEFLSGRLPLKFLLGTPIGFLGGNALVLLSLLALAGWGLLQRFRARAGHLPVDLACLLVWLCLPPMVLYGYSLVGSPIFGPSRYTLFVAPVYLLLVAQGLVKLPVAARLAAGMVILAFVGHSLATTVYRPGLKADWRGFARVVAARLDARPHARMAVLVLSPDPGSGRNVEVETARYYLPERCRVLGVIDPEDPQEFADPGEEPFLAAGFKESALGPPPRLRASWVLELRFPGLAVYRRRQP